MEIGKAVRDFLKREIALCRALDIEEDTALISSSLLDSIEQIRLVSFLERSFDIAIENQDIEAGRLETIASIEKLVQSRRSL